MDTLQEQTRCETHTNRDGVVRRGNEMGLRTKDFCIVQEERGEDEVKTEQKEEGGGGGDIFF